MKNRNVALTIEVHKKLEEAKDKYGYKTFNDFIKSLCLFIEANNLNPALPYERDTNNVRQYFDDLRKLQKDDSQSMRKFIGALEKNYLKPILKRLEMEEVLKAIALEKKTDEVPVQEIQVKPISEDIDRTKQQITEIREAKNEALQLANKYKKMLKELTSKIGIKETMLGKVCEVKMTISEWEAFKKQIDF